MAINGRFRVSMADVFPAGAFVVGSVEAVRDFDKSTRRSSSSSGTGRPACRWLGWNIVEKPAESFGTLPPLHLAVRSAESA
ncbi:MAG: hypothetical protein ACRDTE_31065 [Pseudonocardiaceae bacterium]